MRYYTVQATAKASQEIMVMANSPEEALELAQKDMKRSYEEEWSIYDDELEPETLVAKGEVSTVPGTLIFK